MSPLPVLLEKCRSAGWKVTPQRVAVFEALLARPGHHPTAEEIHHDVQAVQPALSFATVYNTLERLVALGELRPIIVNELRRRYDLRAEAHQHALCRACGTLADVHHPESAAAVRQLESADLSAYGFAVESATVEFHGLCADCAGGSSPQRR